MRDSVASSVHSIIRHGLSLRDRLEAGEPLVPALEQATLIDMLAPLALEEIWDAEEEASFGLDLAETDARDLGGRLSQATIRYALVAWLDTLLARYSLWGSTWNEHSLEAALYGTERRGKKFWEEARYAETRKDLDALEVLYWCVLLGFRGEARDLAEPTGVWTARIRALLDAAVDRADTSPAPCAAPAATPATDLPYRRMMFAALMTLAIALPASLWLVWRVV